MAISLFQISVINNLLLLSSIIIIDICNMNY